MRVSLTRLLFSLHPLLSVRKQPLNSIQNVLQGSTEQRCNHGRQGFSRRGHRALGGGRHLPHCRHEVPAGDGDGGDVQQELLGRAVDLWVAAAQGTQRCLGAHGPDVSTAVT